MKTYICLVYFEKTDSKNYVTCSAENEEMALLACQDVIDNFPFDLGDGNVIEIREVNSND